MSEQRFAFLRRDTWSGDQTLNEIMDVADERVRSGQGPFSITRDGKPKFDDLKRQEALDKLRSSLKDAKVMTPWRVRNPHRSVFTARRVTPDDGIEKARVGMVRWGRWGIARNFSIHYSQARPVPAYSPNHLPMTLDCSSSTILFAKWSGINDLSKVGSSTFGNTDTLMSNLRQVSRGDAKIGDLACWVGHTTFVLEDDPDPLLFSHGMESGPIAYRLSFAERFHSGTARFLDLTS